MYKLKLLLTVILLAIVRPSLFCQHLLVETMASTFNFQTDTLVGTCFLINESGKQYLVTAAHLFKSTVQSGETVPVQIFVNDQLESFDAKVYFHSNKNVDVAIMKLSKNVAQGKGISLDSTQLDFGTEVFFYGFPLTNLGTEIPGIKFPLVKKAIISGAIKYNGVQALVLDGHNNHGFSGGPVLAYNTNTKKMCVIAIVSSYLFESRKALYKGEKIAFDENSGIILCYGGNYIRDILKENK